MGQPGFTVMVNQLFDADRGQTAFAAAIGKTISELQLGEEDTGLHFVFDDGSRLRIFDDGQSCCEHRYMRTDDDLNSFVGAKLIDAEIKDGPEEKGEYDDVHEVQFLEIKTDKGSFVMSSHNEHNGYYGGFWLRAAAEGPKEKKETQSP